MKKILATLFLVFSFACAGAEELKFLYNTKAEVVSCYIWRGQYCGGLSFQPDLYLGWSSEHTSFYFGTWWNLGASDWGFRSGLPVTEDYNPNTQFLPESDIYGTLNLWGTVVGFAHLYFFDGDFFNFGDVNEINGSAQTEVTVGYDFSTLMPNVDLQLTWNTIVSGADWAVDGKRCFSTYIEARYCHHFAHGIDLAGVFGFSPWRSLYTDIYSDSPKDFAVNNLTLRVDKTWPLCNDSCELDLFLQGTLNICNLNGDNAVIRASGDDKLYMQKLMGAIGISFSFGN